jgi:hypothetical protein
MCAAAALSPPGYGVERPENRVNKIQNKEHRIENRGQELITP